jgi:hypothetical protein
LAAKARCWIVTHQNELRSCVLALDGVVADHNAAFRLRDGTILSTQIYRDASAAEHQFSRLAAVMQAFFETGERPWPAERDFAIVKALERMRLSREA